jgi:GGDEF domain-containing protein
LKEINDVFGHAMGDKVLIEVANCLQDCTRWRAARLGR